MRSALIVHELRLIWRARLSLLALVLLLALTAAAIWSGLHEVSRQRATIAHLQVLQQEDVTAFAQRQGKNSDPGNAAYYTYYGTWDTPSDAAFLALGLRDVAPYVLRIRALNLQSQLYDGESFNPELALPGRFDFAFVLIYLTPLFVIALLYDLVSSERQSGRLRMLSSLPDNSAMWRRRVTIRCTLLFAAMGLPLLIGAGISGLALNHIAIVLAIVATYIAFWAGVSLWIGTRGRGSAANATALMGVWAALTLVLPSLANVVLTRSVPVHQGVDLMLAQREVVHGAWEVPREDTMRKFYALYPQWKDGTPVGPAFHWKWYFAFHQLGDHHVAAQAKDYRDRLMLRQEWTERLGWVLPGVGAQALLHRLSATDLPAQLDYQGAISNFHREIREFYYPYLFTDKPFSATDFDKRPVFREEKAKVELSVMTILPTTLIAWLALLLGMAGLRRVRAIGD